MNKLFKRATRTVAAAKENLIDDAQEINNSESSNDPVNAISAVDFDAEIQEVLGKQGANPADEGTGEPDADPAADDGTEPAPEGTEDGGTGEEADPAPEGAEGDEPGPDTEDDGEEPAEIPADAPNGAEVAVERIVRLTRVLEALDQSHECGVVSPLLANLANDEVDTTARILDIEQPPAPALESQNNPDSRFQATRARVMEILKKAWELLKKWWAASSKWFKEFRDGYMARQGQYPRTVEGYRMRLKTFGDFASDKTFEAKLGALSHSGNNDTIESAIIAAHTCITTALNITTACTRIKQTDIMSLPSSVAAGNSLLTFPDPVRVFGIQGSGSQLSTDAMIKTMYKPGSGTAPSTFKLSGIPGGKDLVWTFGDVHSALKNTEDIIRQLALFSFTLSSSSAAHTDVNIPISVAKATALLDAAEMHAKSAATIAKSLAHVQETLSVLRQYIEAALKSLNDKADDPAIAASIHSHTRAMSLWASAYERAYVRPVVEAARLSNSNIDQMIRLAAEVVAHLEEEEGGKKDEV